MVKTVFNTYEEAFQAAQDEANKIGRDMGLEKAKEFGETVYRVKYLPVERFRCGWELRCEIVQPIEKENKQMKSCPKLGTPGHNTPANPCSICGGTGSI